MNYLEKWMPGAQRRAGTENVPDVSRNWSEDFLGGNYSTAKVLGGAVLALIALGVAANFPQIRRYVRMELM